MGGTVYGVNEDTGAVQWNRQVDAEGSSPAFGDSGLYVTYSALHYYKLGPKSGHIIWRTSSDLNGGAGYTPAYYKNRLYVRDWNFSSLILGTGSGEVVGSHGATRAPAFWQSPAGQSFEITLYGTKLFSVDTSSGNVVWSFGGFVGDDQLWSAPIVVNNVVAIGSYSGTLHILDAATGAELWSTNVGAPILPSGETQANGTWTGLGAGQDTLIVPATNLLIAYVGKQQ